MSIRDTPMGRPGPTGPHSSASRHFGDNPGNPLPPYGMGAPGSPTGGPGGTRAYWDQAVPGRYPGGPQTLGQQSLMREGMPGFRPSPADMAGATGRQIAGSQHPFGPVPGGRAAGNARVGDRLAGMRNRQQFPGEPLDDLITGGPLGAAETEIQGIMARNSLRTRGKTREQMGLKKPDPHPGHNPNAPAHENAWDHLSANLNFADRRAWDIVNAADDIAMQEIMHISPTIGGNIPFYRNPFGPGENPLIGGG